MNRKEVQAILFAFEGGPNDGFNRQKLQSTYYKYIQNVE